MRGEHLARAFAETDVLFRITLEVFHTGAAWALVQADAGVGLISSFGFLSARG